MQSVRLLSVQQGTDAAALAVELTVQETDSSIYAWSLEEELSAGGYRQATLPEGDAPEAIPFPWSPGYAVPLAGDALNGPAGFGIVPRYGIDAQGNPALRQKIKGSPPINNLDNGIAAPYVKAVGAEGGSLPAGTYVVAVSAYDAGAAPYKNTRYLDLAAVTVADGGSIAASVEWGAGDDGGDLYVARPALNDVQGAQLQEARQWDARCVFHRQQTIAPGVTAATVDSFTEASEGGPDTRAHHLGIVWQRVIHGGVWAQQVQGVPSADTIQIGGDGMPANLWAGRVLTLLAKVSVGVEVRMLNLPIASSSESSDGMFTLTIVPNAVGDTLPDLREEPILEVGDLVVMRNLATFGDDYFEDDLIANPYYPEGATGVEVGHLAVVLTGPDAGDVQPIASVAEGAGGKATKVMLAGQWQTRPNTGDLVIIGKRLTNPS